MVLLGISLKTYFTPSETVRYLEDLQPVFELVKVGKVQLFIIPDFVSLSVVERKHVPDHVWLGAQDTFHASGAYTGTISPRNLADLGTIKLVEIGHAERRRIFHETDEIVAEKAESLVQYHLTPLLCIGEPQEYPNSQQALEYCIAQVEAVSTRIKDSDPLLIAYEPVWAIGKSQPADVAHIRHVIEGLKTHLGPDRLVIYGGSAGEGLYSSLKGSIDGLFLGRFGHQPTAVERIVKEMVD